MLDWNMSEDLLSKNFTLCSGSILPPFFSNILIYIFSIIIFSSMQLSFNNTILLSFFFTILLPLFLPRSLFHPFLPSCSPPSLASWFSLSLPSGQKRTKRRKKIKTDRYRQNRTETDRNRLNPDGNGHKLKETD